MTVEYSMYFNVEQSYVELFDKYWDKHYKVLPELPSLLLGVKDSKASVFNTWVTYNNKKKYLVLMSEKTFTHSFIVHLTNKLKFNMPENTKETIKAQLDNPEFLFVFSYMLTKLVINEMESILTKHDELKCALRPNFFLLKDEDVEETDPMFYFFKVFIDEFINGSLNQYKCKSIYLMSIGFTEEFLKMNTA